VARRMPPAGEHRFAAMVERIAPQLARRHGFGLDVAREHARRIAAAACAAAHGKAACQRRAAAVRRAKDAAAHAGLLHRAARALRG
jgi:hypothetical protein